MAPHIAAMAANIAADLDVAPALVNIKAKTAEGLGYLGSKEGIAADAVVLLVRGGGGAYRQMPDALRNPNHHPYNRQSLPPGLQLLTRRPPAHSVSTPTARLEDHSATV